MKFLSLNLKYLLIILSPTKKATITVIKLKSPNMKSVGCVIAILIQLYRKFNLILLII